MSLVHEPGLHLLLAEVDPLANYFDVPAFVVLRDCVESFQDSLGLVGDESRFKARFVGAQSSRGPRRFEIRAFVGSCAGG